MGQIEAGDLAFISYNSIVMSRDSIISISNYLIVTN